MYNTCTVLSSMLAVEAICDLAVVSGYGQARK